MTEFEEQLLETLKGIQQEMIISNHKTERMKKIQIQYFELDSVKTTYLQFYNRTEGEQKEDMMNKIRETTKKMTELELKGARDV
jgi:hypothetical protein